MSRSKRFFSGLVTSYVSIGVNILYTLASVPIALHYLSKEEFGMWALVSQLTGYLMLLEFGMTGSVSRFLTDHKDDINGGVYGSILKTGSRVFLFQGLLVAIAAFGLSLVAPGLLDFDPVLKTTFTMLMALQGVLTGFKLATGAMIAPLWSHQRLDISNLGSCVSLIVNFAVLWLGFHLGWRLYSLVIATASGFLVSLVICYLSCLRLRLLPTRGHSGRFDPQLFRELFGFGGGLFLMNVGAQLASASQVILVSRFLGLEAASVWSISTKVFSLAQQFVTRILDASAGGLAEMVARNEKDRMLRRFRDIVMLTGVIAAASAAGIALINAPFVEIWTSGRISWSPVNDLLLAGVLFSSCITRCHTGLVGLTKQIRGMKYVYLVEGFAFVGAVLIMGSRFGFTGILAAALICNVLVTGLYGILRSASYFQINSYQVIGWIARPIGLLGLIAVLFSLTRIPALVELGAPLRVTAGAAAFLVIFIPALWTMGLNRSLREELETMVLRLLGRGNAPLRPAAK